MESSKQKKIPRQQSLLMPEIVNPFIHKFPNFTTAEKIQLAFMTITIFPLRLLLVGVCLVVAWSLATVALWGISKEEQQEPLKGWRKVFEYPLLYSGRLTFFIMGYHRIKITGKQALAKEAPILCMAPHSSYFDAVGMFACNTLATPISRIEQENAPVMGTLTAFTQPVFVSREDYNSRQNTIKEIKRRAESRGKWPQIIIFPEGTCTNRSCLITFKSGAFIPGLPVQPVVLKYLNKYDTITWTWDGPGALTLLWLTLCQVSNKLEIEFLPVYEPNEEERKDPVLFGRNVRAKMAEALGVPVTDHTFEDCRLMSYAAQLNMPFAAVLVEFQKLSRKLGVNFDNLMELLTQFSAVAQQNSGQVTVEQFAELLEMPVSDALQEMFDLYDRDDSGTIDFREYVIGLHLISRPANTEETLQFAFELFDKGGKGYITEEELRDVLYQAFGMQEANVKKIFAHIPKQSETNITYDEFKNYAKIRPEYARLFTTYQEQKQSKANGRVSPSTSKTE